MDTSVHEDDFDDDNEPEDASEENKTVTAVDPPSTAPSSPSPSPGLLSTPSTSSFSTRSPVVSASIPLSPRACELPLSSSFLQSLATLPALSPSLMPTPPSSTTSPPSNDLSSPSDAEPSPYVPCPCQADPASSHLLSPRKKGSPVQATSPPSSSSPTHAASASASARPSIPSSISLILSSISTAQSAPSPSPTSPAPSFSPTSHRQIVDYLESLCHHLSHTQTTLIRYLQHCRHAQLLPPSDPLLVRLEQSNLRLVNALKQLRVDEEQARLRLQAANDVIEGGRRTQALSLSRLPSFMQTEKRRQDELDKAKAARDEEQQRQEGLTGERGRVQQQLMAVSGVTGELRKEGGGRVKYEVALDGLMEAPMREAIGELEAEEAVQRLRLMARWREQEDIAEQKLKQVTRVEKEMRDRLDQLVCLYYK